MMCMTIDELNEQQRKIIEEDGPWNNGGKQACCDRMAIAMPHDELAKRMGAAYDLMTASGFVMMPKTLQADFFRAIEQRRNNQERPQ